MKYNEFYDAIFSVGENLIVKADCSNSCFKQSSDYVTIIDIFIDNGIICFHVECEGEVLQDTDMCLETNGVFDITADDILSVETNQYTTKYLSDLVDSNNVINIDLVDISDITLTSIIDIKMDVDIEIKNLSELINKTINNITYLSNNLLFNFTEKQIMILNKNGTNYYGYDELVGVPESCEPCDHMVLYNKLKQQKSYLRSLKTIKTIIKNNKNG